MTTKSKGLLQNALGDYDGILFYTTAVIAACVVAIGAIAPDTLNSYCTAARNYLTNKFGWAYLLALSSYVGFGLWVAMSKYGDLTLGKEGEKPEFNTFSWIAMLFSCGIGVGYVLWGRPNPCSTICSPPTGRPPAPPMRSPWPSRFRVFTGDCTPG